MFNSLSAQRLLALFVAGWIAFSFPMLGLWDRAETLLGIPFFPLALFVVWALLIVAVGLITERSTHDAD